MSKRKKAPSGNPANRGLSFVDRRIARDFERWLAASDTPLSDPHNAAGAVGHLFDITKRSGLDILEPSDTADIADMLLDIGPNATGMVDLFHDYVHFRLETSRDPRWHQAHDELEDVLDDDTGISAMLEAIITDAETRDPAVIADALAHTKVIDGVTKLLDWISTSRPITDTGALRLSDIEPAAAALGLRAAGARTLPATGDLHGQTAIADGITYVQSMWHLEPLAAWWRALLDTDVLELTASRVRPGRASQRWRTEPTPPLDVASEVVALVVSDTVLGDLPRPLRLGCFTLPGARHTCARGPHPRRRRQARTPHRDRRTIRPPCRTRLADARRSRPGRTDPQPPRHPIRRSRGLARRLCYRPARGPR
ncbi:hypothetical protein IT882_02370 [Microbacterium schleiferi]|uniref:Uncharacterized protein n=1 Tax=Microbacterium schleiferi TaxID=69362 RepID=A0A7S8MXZ1_9MICO|nr:hypothetical protein [Microbacterium schleiferi]QPE04988.1 hypothetical protein IT882_02370 [Microbacterium schleiferi]